MDSKRLSEPRKWHRHCLLTSWVIVWTGLLGSNLSFGNAPSDATISNLSLGFDGQVLLGRWVPYRIEISGDFSSPPGSVVVEALDGDAVPAGFQQALSGEDNVFRGLIRIGRAGAITVRVFDSQNHPLAEREFSYEELQETHSFEPATLQLTLEIGGAPAADTAPTTGFDSGATAQVNDLSNLPRHWLGYDSVRTITVIGARPDELAQLDQQQIEAIEKWVMTGGRLLISCARAADQLMGSQGILARFAPGDFDELRETRDSGDIELFVGSNDQLVTPSSDPLSVAVFETSPGTWSGIVDLSLKNIPVLIHRPFGLGIVSVLTLDIDSEPLRGWPGRAKLLRSALLEQVSSEAVAGDARSGSKVSHYGYKDLSGQLRAAMEQFKNVSFVTFTLVAVLIALFILLIGPIDYFLVRRVVKRMEWTWVTFIGFAIGFCLLIIVIAGWSKSAAIELNQVEVIDVDASGGFVRGTVWAHLYSPRTELYQVSLPGENRWFGQIQERWLTWQGLPGSGLGGMQTRSDLGQYRRSYESPIAFPPLDNAGSEMKSVPLQTAATKSLIGRWTKSLDSSVASNLQEHPTTNAVIGTLTNPLPTKLYNCVVLYGGWAYVLERSLDANETIDVDAETREKTLKNHFTRRQVSGERDITTAWKTGDTSIPRIMDMMMFYEVAGGQGYTTLTHDYQQYLDLSEQLRLGRAILVGQIPQASTAIQVNDKVTDRYDQQLTFVRIVFPVQPR